MGKAIGATVLPRALDVGAFDVAVVIKRPPADVIARIHQANVPLIYDVVDAWPQPGGNEWCRAECMAWLTDRIRAMRPAGIVAATEQMAKDCEQFGVPVLALPHHARPGLKQIEIRPVRTVSYEGGVQHLGKWKSWLEWECSSRGWRFAVDEPGDIAIALREKTGYAPMNWKSNVKLANAQASGTPIICAREKGYLETSSGAEFFADTEEEVQWALDALTAVDVRRDVAQKMLKAAPSLDSVAATYRQWLQKF